MVQLCLFALLSVSVAVSATFTPNISDPGQRTLVREQSLPSGSRASLYTIEAPGYSDPFYVFNVSAKTSYDTGYLYGKILGNQSIQTFDILFNALFPNEPEIQHVFQRFLLNQFDNYAVKGLPQKYLDEIRGFGQGVEDIGIPQALDYLKEGISVAAIAVGSVDADILYLLENELLDLDPLIQSSMQAKGLTHGQIASAISSSRLLNLFKTCSMFGVWGSRTPNGRLRTGRNLDWLAGSGIASNKLITVYHTGSDIPYASIGFIGLPGAITGMSSAGITVHEAGNDNKQVTLEGFVWHMRLRELMATAHNLSEARNFWKNTNNTMGINHGIGSSSEPGFIALETKAGYTAYFEDNDPREANYEYDGVKYGFPLKEAIWRTNHGYDQTVISTNVEGPKPGKDTFNRYKLLHDTFVYYADNDVEVDVLQAINLTAIVGDKGGSSTESFLTCEHASKGENVITASFFPDQKLMYLAFEDGVGETHVPGCCNNYIKFDMSEWF